MENVTDSTKEENYQKMLKALGEAMTYARLYNNYTYEVYESLIGTSAEELEAAENGCLEDFVRVQDLSAVYFANVLPDLPANYLIKFGKLSKTRNKELLNFLMSK